MYISQTHIHFRQIVLLVSVCHEINEYLNVMLSAVSDLWSGVNARREMLNMPHPDHVGAWLAMDHDGVAARWKRRKMVIAVATRGWSIAANDRGPDHSSDFLPSSVCL